MCLANSGHVHNFNPHFQLCFSHISFCFTWSIFVIFTFILRLSVCLSVYYLSFPTSSVCLPLFLFLLFQITCPFRIKALRRKTQHYFLLRLGTVDGIHLLRGPERKQDQGRLRVEQLTLQKWDSKQLSLIDEVIIRFRAFTFGDGYSFEVCVPELVLNETRRDWRALPELARP